MLFFKCQAGVVLLVAQDFPHLHLPASSETGPVSCICVFCLAQFFSAWNSPICGRKEKRENKPGVLCLQLCVYMCTDRQYSLKVTSTVWYLCGRPLPKLSQPPQQTNNILIPRSRATKEVRGQYLTALTACVPGKTTWKRDKTLIPCVWWKHRYLKALLNQFCAREPTSPTIKVIRINTCYVLDFAKCFSWPVNKLSFEFSFDSCF